MSTLTAASAEPVALTILSAAREVPLPAKHHKFTVAEYEEMHRSGILTERDKVELIFGEIVRKMVIGDPHIGCVIRLTRFFVKAVGESAAVSVQNGLAFSDSCPEPDLALLKPSSDDYGTHKARPADVLLLIEVADTSLAYDRTVKGPLYASEGIPEYWIVNLIDRCLEVNRLPQADGTYSDRRVLEPGETMEPLLLPGVRLWTNNIF